MESSADSYCRRAVAYLKVESPADEVPQFVRSQGNSPVLRPLGHGLLVAYLALAIANLGAMAGDAEVRQHGNMYAILMGGRYEASLILFNDFWSEWYAGLAPSGFVAAFP